MKTEILSGSAAVAQATSILRTGGLVALPTETVYGLAARALDPVACARIFEAKARPLSDPLIVHLPSTDWLLTLAQPSPLALQLAEAFWPGPLTLVVPRRSVVPDLVTAGQATVALRMSAHPVFRSIADALVEPIAAPSANRFGRISPTHPDHVLEELGGRIPLIVDGGSCPHGIESTIALPKDGRIHILRRGPVTSAMLAEFAPVSEAPCGITAPGTMKSHYAPATPLRLVEPPATSSAQNCGLLAWSTPLSAHSFAAIEILTPSGDSTEAATRLYAAMRRLDACGLNQILAEIPPAGALGDAIRERLEKAASR